MNKNLTTTNQNAKLALNKSKSLLDITNKLLSKKDIDTLVQSFNFTPFVRENGHSILVESVAISPDGKTIVSGSYDNTIKIWDIQSGECLNTLEGHSYSVESVAISPDGKTIVSGSGNGTIKIWDIKSGKLIYTTYNFIKSEEYFAAIDPDGYFYANNKAIDEFLRVSEEPLSQRKLTDEEIKHFRKKGNFLEVGEIVPKSKVQEIVIKKTDIPFIDIDEDEIPF